MIIIRSGQTVERGNLVSRVASSSLYKILSQISDQSFDPDLIFSAFRKEIPAFVDEYSIVLLKASIYEPVRRSIRMNVTDIELYNAHVENDTNSIELEFKIVNGGKVVITTVMSPNSIWTEEAKEDNYVLSRLIFLLVGRAKTTMSLKNIMFTDRLTGISNEASLGQFMNKAISMGVFANYCSNFVNIKNMKVINSRYSDSIGNVILTGYAQKLSAFAEERGNGIAARLGGDNFLVFIEADKENEFLEFIKDIHILYTSCDDVPVKVDSRVGYYFIKKGDGLNDVMSNADIACKLARNDTYPDYVMFEPSMMIHTLKMKQLEQNIPDAIKNREFVVYYQPKADISEEGNYKTNGAEALVRWGKDGELIPPGEFIPALEKSGLVSLIDYYVLEQVCVDITKWISMGLKPVKVSSNFSRRHLHDAMFADKVEAIIKKHNVDPSLIEIEITESYEAEDMEALKRFEQRMHLLGVELSVDDFGSGFSSIRMIKNIVSDTIKIDKSIIDGVGDNGSEDIIISHIISMINSLGKKIVAEGVETEKQAKFLRMNNCMNIQGFLYARPCAEEIFVNYLK